MDNNVNNEIGNFAQNDEKISQDSTYDLANATVDNANLSASKGKLSLILGIISVGLTCLCSCFPASIVLSIISIISAFKSKKLSAENKFSGMALGGLISAICGIVISALFVISVAIVTIVMINNMDAVNEFLAEYYNFVIVFE